MRCLRHSPETCAWCTPTFALRSPDGAAVLPLGRFARLRIANASFRLHPMHIHGMFFKVIARNGMPVDEPLWRDTALVHSKETPDVGLVPLDPGKWMLHSHILEHASRE